MVEVSNNFIQECEANVGTYKFGKIKVNYIDDNPLNYEQGAYSSSDGAKIDAEQSIRYNKLVECKPNFKYKIELGDSAYKMKIVTYTEAQAFIAVHDNLTDGNELTTEATAKYISVTIYSNDTLEGTSITLNNTIRNGEILGAELKGNTIQNGTPTPTSPIEVKTVTGEQVVRVCKKNIFDKSKVIAGYRFGSDGELYSQTGCNATDFIPVTPSTNYDVTWTIAWDEVVCLYDINKTFTRRLMSGLNFTTEANEYFVRVDVKDGHLDTAQIAKGTSESFEAYQGKDYEINLKSRNLLIQNRTTTVVSGVTFTINEDGSVTCNGTATDQYCVFDIGRNTGNILPSGTYIASGIQGTGSNETYRIAMWKNVNGTVTNINTILEGSKSFSLTENAEVFYRIIIANGYTVENLTFYPMIEQGSTATDYTSYYNIELNKIGNYQDFIRKGTGKNLYGNAIKTDNVSTSINTIVEDTSNRLEIQGVSSYYSGIYKKYQLNPNTQYTISTFYSDLSNSAMGAILYKLGDECEQVATNNRDGLKVIGTERTSLSFTTDSTGLVAILFCCNWTANNGHIVYNDIQLEKGTATYYEPYGYKDKWYIERNVGKVILDSSNEVASFQAGTTSDVYRFAVGVTGIDSIGIDDAGTDSQLFCNLLKATNRDKSYAKVEGICYGMATNTSYKNFIVYTDETKNYDVATFKTWLGTNKPIVYYIKQNTNYTLIENEELLNQLEVASHAKTQEGISNILVSGNLPATLKITPDLTESIRGKQATPIVGYNITGDDDLINFKITSKADSNGNILGATSQSQVDIEIFNENNTHNLENKQVYISTGLAETEGNYCKWQPFTITQTKDTQTKNHTTYTGYDDMMRGNEAYIDNIDYGEDGITLYDFTCNLAKEMGMALGNTTMTNGDFIVKGNNFTNNETKLVVLKNVAQMVGGFAMIDRGNFLRIVELSPEDAMTPIELTTNLYTEDFQNSAKFGEINEIAIGETNLETNAIVRSDEEAIAKDGVKKIEILDNLFLGMLVDKELAIDPLWDAFEGFNYYPFKTQYNGYPYIDLGDKLNITDINSNVYGTMVLNHVFEYNGGYKGNIGAEALSITAAKYQPKNTLGKAFQKVGIDINRVEGKITQEVTAMSDDLTTAYSGAIETSEQNIMGQVETIQTTLYGPKEHPEKGLEKIVESHSTKIEETSSFVNVDIKNKLDTTYNMADAVTNNTKEIVESFNFNENGMLITNKGTETADMALLVSNSAITFKYRGNDVLVINGEKIEFSAVSFKKLDLGNYVWQAEQDDSLSLIYEGGNT